MYSDSGYSFYPAGGYYEHFECQPEDGDGSGDQAMVRQTWSSACSCGAVSGNGRPPADRQTVPAGDACNLERNVSARDSRSVSDCPKCGRLF